MLLAHAVFCLHIEACSKRITHPSCCLEWEGPFRHGFMLGIIALLQRTTCREVGACQRLFPMGFQAISKGILAVTRMTTPLRTEADVDALPLGAKTQEKVRVHPLAE